MNEWYLAYCKARQEEKAARGLEEQGYHVYLPKVRLRKRRASGKITVDEPLFPRYLFFAPVGQDQSIAPAKSTIGVQKLVEFGSSLLPVSASVVEALKLREDPATGRHKLGLPNVRQGDKVRIKTGVLAGIEGIFEARSGDDRVVVLLQILGQQTRAVVPIDELER